MSQVPDAHTKPYVLVGVDGSRDGLRAVSFGAYVAEKAGARLRLVHAVDDAVLAGAWGVVYDPTVLQAAGEKANVAAVQTAKDAGLPESQIDAEVVLGNASAVLARLSEGAGLLVVGRRAVGGLERMFVGSTSVSVASMAHCPVVVISQAVNPDRTGGHGMIVAGVDAGPHASKALDWAFAEAASRDAKLLIVHVSEPRATGLFGRGKDTPEAREAQVAAAEQGVRGLVDQVSAKYPRVEYTIDVTYGNAVDALVSRTGHADLLVLNAARNAPGHATGGTARGVMAHAQCPVCLVP